MNYVLEKLSENSTWRGLIGLATAGGVVLSPDLQGAIIAMGMALIGLINVVRKEKQK